MACSAIQNNASAVSNTPCDFLHAKVRMLESSRHLGSVLCLVMSSPTELESSETDSDRQKQTDRRDLYEKLLIGFTNFVTCSHHANPKPLSCIFFLSTTFEISATAGCFLSAVFWQCGGNARAVATGLACLRRNRGKASVRSVVHVCFCRRFYRSFWQHGVRPTKARCRTRSRQRAWAVPSYASFLLPRHSFAQAETDRPLIHSRVGTQLAFTVVDLRRIRSNIPTALPSQRLLLQPTRVQ